MRSRREKTLYPLVNAVHQIVGRADPNGEGRRALPDRRPTFRHLHPDTIKAYTRWNLMSKARERNVGWRIDHLLISEALQPNLAAAAIHADVMGSDHCPVSITLDL